MSPMSLTNGKNAAGGSSMPIVVGTPSFLHRIPCLEGLCSFARGPWPPRPIRPIVRVYVLQEMRERDGSRSKAYISPDH